MFFDGRTGQKDGLPMVFNRHPQPLAAPLDDEVYFECSLNIAAEKFAWRHRPLGSEHWGPLINAPNSGGKTSKHVVNFDDPSKAGDYRCIAFYGERSSLVLVASLFPCISESRQPWTIFQFSFLFWASRQ